MVVRAVIFDLDGTLLDTLGDLADSMNGVLVEHGLPPHPVDAYRYFVGDGIPNLIRRAAPPGTGSAVREALAAGMDAAYAVNWAKGTRPYPGIPELLATLRRRGLPLAVLSNKPDRFTRRMTDYFFPAGTFAAVFGARDTVARKPDPAGALEIAARLAIPPAEFLYFGDTDTDMKTGRAAGMYTVGVGWGFRPVAELWAAGAQLVIESPAEALALAPVSASGG
ncbi:MAG: HAD-IA family hydrolase [Planctomycetes bacterium]|nr:HAD-IA family hydrolase [Planctomycetota bacterium]